jgi:hypothetical protein
MAPPDFNAVTLLDYAATRATLGVIWLPGGTAMPFSGMTATGLTLNPEAMPPPVGAIRVGAALIGLDSLATALQVTPASGDVRRAYVIAYRPGAGGLGRIQHFSDFGDFVAALDAALDTATLVKLHAAGTFDAPAVSFNARQLLVVLGD